MDTHRDIRAHQISDAPAPESETRARVPDTPNNVDSRTLCLCCRSLRRYLDKASFLTELRQTAFALRLVIEEQARFACGMSGCGLLCFAITAHGSGGAWNSLARAAAILQVLIASDVWHMALVLPDRWGAPGASPPENGNKALI